MYFNSFKNKIYNRNYINTITHKSYNTKSYLFIVVDASKTYKRSSRHKLIFRVDSYVLLEVTIF